MDPNVTEPPAATARQALIDRAGYERMYRESLADPDKFWGEQAKRLTWFKDPTKVKNTRFTGDVQIRWFEDGALNASYNCVDRHLATRGDQVAIIWEGDDPGKDAKITYRE